MTKSLPTVLLTGFTPFDGDALNPSWQAVRALDGRRIAGHRVVAVELPTEFGAALPALRRTLRVARPRLAIAFGLAGGRAGISLERVALNVIDARIPDNAGAQPIDVPVLRSGPAAYFSTLPIKAMLAALQRSDIPAGISQTAGTYVCNQVFYALMHAARRQRFQAGFVHVPWLSGQATRHAAPGMPLAQMQQAVGIIVRVALTTAGDARRSGGAEA
jgi:pyroglutamyl-peptidase